MAKKVQYTTNTPSSSTDYLAADNTWKPMSGGGGGVPYTGATGNVDLGEWELKSGQLELDQTPTGTAGVAVMRWNDSDGTIDVGLKGGNVTLQVGQEEVIRVVNKTGANLLEANYQCVRVRTQAEGGAQGQRLAVKLAQADTKANHTGVIGLVTETINNNQEGFITTFGYVRDVDTTGSLQGETWLDGDVLWLSDTTAGGLTNIEPTVHPVQIGYVVYAHQNNGKIFVRVSEGVDELNELHDVTITSPSNGDVLTYNSTSGLWENQTPSGGSSSKSILNQNHGSSLIGGLGVSYGGWSGVTTLANITQEFARNTLIPLAGTIKNWAVLVGNQPATGSLVLTLRVNSVDTAMTITIAAGSLSNVYYNNSTSISVVAGNAISFKAQNNASTSSGAIITNSIIYEI